MTMQAHISDYYPAFVGSPPAYSSSITDEYLPTGAPAGDAAPAAAHNNNPLPCTLPALAILKTVPRPLLRRLAMDHLMSKVIKRRNRPSFEPKADKKGGGAAGVFFQLQAFTRHQQAGTFGFLSATKRGCLHET